ncbi:MAG: glycosyltransferase [bacterium]|nr:glycosyltransferase [bacterium]
MRILHLGKYYHPRRGGMETVLRHLAEGTAARGHRVDVLVAGHAADSTSEAVAGGGVRVTRALTWGEVASQPVTPTLAGLVRRILTQDRPDLVHLHLPNPLACAAWLMATAGGPAPPLAVWHHADIRRQRLGRFFVRPLQRLCLERAAGVCVSSQALRVASQELKGLEEGVRVVPFGLPEEPWSALQPRRDGPFLFVGRLVPYKGLRVLLDALARTPAGRLVVVGDGPLRRQLCELATQPTLSGRVELTGELDEPDLLARLEEARALVLPSLDTSETFGLAQLEAMAAGVPVVASDLPTGVRELGVEGESHLYVPPGDAAALAAALDRLQGDDELTARLGEGARRRAAAYGRDRMVDELLDWYGTLLGPTEA